jgi:hypothetical protein
MSDTNPNTPTVDELSARLAAIRTGMAKGLGLAEDATDEALLARAAEVAKERDDSRAEVATLKSAADSGKVDAALRDAFAKSGADPRNAEDFLSLARPLFGVDAKTGAVATKADAPNTVPGASAEAWIVAELRAKRPHWWALSTGGGARGAGLTSHGGGDDSCFDPRSPNYNFTRQLEAEAKHGPAFADKARAKYRGRGGW